MKKIPFLGTALCAVLVLLPAGAAQAAELSAILSGNGQGLASIVTDEAGGQVTYGIITQGIGTPNGAQILQGGGVFVSLAAGFTGGSAAGTVATGADLAAMAADPGNFSVRVQGPGGTVQGPLVLTGEGEEPPPGDQCPDGFFSDPEYPDFCFNVTIAPPGQPPMDGSREETCVPDPVTGTVCVSGALPGRAEVFIRILGPRPNGFLWPTITRFTPSQVTVEIFQISSGEDQSYTLDAVVGGDLTDLSGLQDRTGFQP